MSISVILILLGLAVGAGAYYCIVRDGARREAAQSAAWRKHCDEYERAARAADPVAEFLRKQKIMAEMFDGDGMEMREKGGGD